MSQYIVTTKDGTQAEAIAKAKEFLESLPNKPHRQSDVIKAVKSISKK